MKSKKSIKKKTVVKNKAVVKTKILPVALSRHVIPKAEGDIMRKRFTDSVKNIGKIVFSTALEFDKLLFEQILQLKGIYKIRVHNAVNANNEHTFIVTAVDGTGDEIYFKIKRQSNTPQPMLKTTAVATPPDNNGVGNMADQCSYPEYKKPI
jgi:hypothetical protein